MGCAGLFLLSISITLSLTLVLEFISLAFSLGEIIVGDVTFGGGDIDALISSLGETTFVVLTVPVEREDETGVGETAF